MGYRSGISRNQMMYASFDTFIPLNSDARVIDAFVDTLDLSDFNNYLYKGVGNFAYDPACLLKIYLLAYRRNIRSSRKIEQALNYNLEFIWISNDLKIKHSTIADFRNKNKHLFKNIMFKFNLALNKFNIISNTDSTDGTKIKAVNSKDRNFTQNKIDDRIKHIMEEIKQYEENFDKEDAVDNEKEILQEKINELQARLEKYEKIQKYLEENNLSQISLTDPESKLMRNNGKFEVCYNNQVEVDMKSHIVKNYQITTNPADLGSIKDISSETKDVYNLDIVTNTTDKGYNDMEDMMNCLENGIIPEVTPPKGKNGFELETDYVENKISEEDIQSKDSDTIKKCLKAGVIPDVYKDVISSIEIKEKNVTNYEDNNEEDTSTEEEKRDYAIKNNCFVRDLKTSKVFCPCGEILRKKSTQGNDKIRYCNKLACKNCKNPCTISEFKVAIFAKNQILSGKNVKNLNKKRNKKVKVKKVIIHTKSNWDLLKNRMATSEHPHGSMKFWDNSRYLLMKGIEKATAELALYYTAYNIRRCCNLIGNEKLIEHFRASKEEKNSNINAKIDYFFHFFQNSFIFC